MLADPDLCNEQSKLFLFYKKEQLRHNIQQNIRTRVAAVKGSRVMYERRTQQSASHNKRQRVVQEEAKRVAPRTGGLKQQLIPEYASVPELTLRKLVERLLKDPENMIMDPRECSCPGCPYCGGCIMGQRYALAKRLVQIEFRLYGHTLPP